MEKITPAQDDQLLDYLDGKLDGAALQRLKQDLASSSQLQARLDELRAVHTVLSTATLQTPSSNFVTKVMKNLHAQPVASSLSPRNGLLLLAGITVAAGMLVALISGGVFDQFNTMMTVNNPAPVQKYFQQSLPSVPINGKLVIDGIIGINLVLAFLILDRTVLRPFFQRRARMQF